MNKRFRQYLGILVAVLVYYVIHEGAHLLAALYYGVFKHINFMGVGVQIDVYHTRMSDMQMGIFCLVGALATFIAGYLFVFSTKTICRQSSAVVRTLGWYTTLTMLMLDPLYLTIFCNFVGGGDMNGISLLMPKVYATIMFAVMGLVNLYVIIKYVYPSYKQSFSDNHSNQ